ncbi:MAG: ATPase domain-containing protein [Halobacteriota archaeon]
MPFDLPKVTAAITLPFLAASLYFTAKEYPNFIIYQNISYIFVIALLLPLFLGIILTFTYLKTISSRTKLRYWEYLSHGLYIHLTVTFYVFSLLFLSWNDATSSTKTLFAMFGLASFAFYMFFTVDLHKILKDQNIKPVFDKLDISRYIVSLCSWFFLILFAISFTYGKRFGVMVDLVSYPVILFFLAFFLIAFITYLSVTHKGFEEIIRKNIWSELSYVSAFIAFLLVYLIYSSLNTYIQRFPYHDFFFIGYFLVLVIEIASIRTLEMESKYKKRGEEDIVHLLNFHAHNFLRTDYLEDLWEKTLDRYVHEDEVTGIRFDPSGRRFDLEKADESTRLEIAVAILLGMHKLRDVEKIAIMKKSIEETKEGIADILKEKVLMLPEDLRCEFDESVYYPILYEKVVNNLLKQLKAFVPFSEQEKIFERLKRRDELFKRIGFEVEEIRLYEGTRFSRDEFLKLFRFYLESLEEKFPFKRFLMYELVRDEIKKELEPYDISVSDLLDIVPTGLEEMDEIMAGGLSKGSSTLLIAEETKTKHKVLLSFIEQGRKESNNVIYATSRHPFQELIGELRVDFKELKNFAIIDLYENIHSEERVYELVEKEHRIIVPLNKILFQRSIVKTIKSQPKEVPKIVVIDVYDDFSRYYSPGEILELLQKQIEGLKRWNCTSVIALDPYSYLIRKKGVEEVKKNFDNVMILSGDDKDASVFIEKLYHGTPSKHIIRLQ